MEDKLDKEVKKSHSKEDRSLAGWSDLILNSNLTIYDAIHRAIKLYKKYRYNRSLLQTERRYVMEAFWKHCEKDKENAERFQDWLFDYYFYEFIEVVEK